VRFSPIAVFAGGIAAGAAPDRVSRAPHQDLCFHSTIIRQIVRVAMIERSLGTDEWNCDRAPGRGARNLLVFSSATLNAMGRRRMEPDISCTQSCPSILGSFVRFRCRDAGRPRNRFILDNRGFVRAIPCSWHAPLGFVRAIPRSWDAPLGFVRAIPRSWDAPLGFVRSISPRNPCGGVPERLLKMIDWKLGCRRSREFHCSYFRRGLTRSLGLPQPEGDRERSTNAEDGLAYSNYTPGLRFHERGSRIT
jgi:hypothetical protein